MSSVPLPWMVSFPSLRSPIEPLCRSFHQLGRRTRSIRQYDPSRLIANVLTLGTEGLTRGAPAHDTGAPIKVPVGPATLGRIINVTGEPIDERGPIKATKFLPIHAEPPEFVDQSTEAEILVTGIKVVDLLAPYARGGKIGLFGGAGVGKTVFIQELIVSFPFATCGMLFFFVLIVLHRTTSPRLTVVTPSSVVSVSVPERVTICTTKCRRLVSFSLMVTPRSLWCSVR